MSKLFNHINYFALLLWLPFLLLAPACAIAKIELSDDTRQINFSYEARAYIAEEELDLQSFRKLSSRLSYVSSQNPNYGLQENSVWLTAEFVNKSRVTNWVIELNFTQLDHVDAHLFQNNELVYFKQGGRLDKKSNHRIPTFRVNLEYQKTYKLYLRVKAKQIPIITPLRILQSAEHAHVVSVDSMIWGVFFGGLFILAFYAASVLITRKEIVAAFLLLHICVVAIWQVVWSGYVQLLPKSITNAPLFYSLDFLLPVVCAISTLYVIVYFREQIVGTGKAIVLRLLCVSIIILVVLMALDMFSSYAQALAIRLIGFFTIIINLYVSIACAKGNHKPAYPIILGFSFLAIGSVVSSFFILGILPSTILNSYVFQLSLVILTCSFAFGLNIRLRYVLEQEIEEATQDAENNFLLIEEQNVHLDMARREALKASEVKSQFLANMSHEIRTPLNAIIGFSREIDAKPDQQEIEEHFRIINSSATDLLTIVNDILDFSKMEAGKLRINNKPFSPAEMFEDVAALFAKTAHLKQLQFTYNVDKMPAVLLGDQFKIKQVLHNLLSNALKFTNYGKIALHAKCQINQNKNDVILFVDIQDSGIGISDVDKTKLFQPFNQLDDELNRSFQGTGLGLVICQELTFLMNGAISVESTPSVGSTFSISLPLKVLEAELMPKAIPFWLNKTAYLFDPNPETRRSTGKLLNAVGVITFTFDSLDALLEQTLYADLAFITLQHKNVKTREQTIINSSALRAKQTVFLYSGPSPDTQQLIVNDNSQVFVNLRLPLTSKKLADIYKVQNTNTQHNLNQSPAISETNLSILPPISVLAVDDMILNLKLLETWFKASPLTLSTANSGKDALRMCESTEYDLILMDIQMPHMDGLQATRLIRKTEKNKGTPIIAITAHAFEEDKQRFLSSGMDDYLPKPIDIKKMIALITEWCPSHAHDPFNQTPVDWQMALHKSNNNAAAAKEYLDAFVAELPSNINQLETLWRNQDIAELITQVHRLHGASSYTGTQGLKRLCDEVETLLKHNELKVLTKPMSALLVEAEAIVDYWTTNKNTLI